MEHEIEGLGNHLPDEPDGFRTNRMGDFLDSLRQRINQESDYVLFDEAAKCFRTGAFRAAYIMTWLSAAESLRNKFVAMASRDDGVGRIVDSIEEAERQAKSVDKLLLEKASDLGMINTEERRKLEYVRDMRNLYAHPSGAGPREGDVRAALCIVVDSVLSKPPLLRHGYVNDLVRSLFEDRHYLNDNPAQIREFAVSVAHRLHPEVVPYLIKKCMERLEQIAIGDLGASIFRRRGIEFGAAILSALRPDLSLPQWNIGDAISRFPSASSALFSVPEIWRLVPGGCRTMIIGHLLEPVEDGRVKPPSSESLGRARALADAGLLEPEQMKKVEEITMSAPLDILKAAGVPLRDYAPRIIEGLASHNWYAQNPASNALYNAGPEECSELDEETQEKLGRNVLQAADGDAWSAGFFVRSLVEQEQTWPQRFVAGLLLETLVNESGTFRLKKRHFFDAILIALKHPDREAIFRLVAEKVRDSRPATDLNKVISLVHEFEEKMVDRASLPLLEMLREAMEVAKASEPEEGLPF